MAHHGTCMYHSGLEKNNRLKPRRFVKLRNMRTFDPVVSATDPVQST